MSSFQFHPLHQRKLVVHKLLHIHTRYGHHKVVFLNYIFLDKKAKHKKSSQGLLEKTNYVNSQKKQTDLAINLAILIMPLLSLGNFSYIVGVFFFSRAKVSPNESIGVPYKKKIK